jgi:hypothetical protein
MCILPSVPTRRRTRSRPVEWWSFVPPASVGSDGGTLLDQVAEGRVRVATVCACRGRRRPDGGHTMRQLARSRGLRSMRCDDISIQRAQTLQGVRRTTLQSVRQLPRNVPEDTLRHAASTRGPVLERRAPWETPRAMEARGLARPSDVNNL